MTKKNKCGSGNTHDKLFRDLISHKKVSTEFFESYMLPEILERLDLSTLKHEKETLVDHDIGDGIVDTLFSVLMKNGEQGYFYLLLEQQSRQENFMSFRVLKYS